MFYSLRKCVYDSIGSLSEWIQPLLTIFKSNHISAVKAHQVYSYVLRCDSLAKSCDPVNSTVT